MEIEEFSYQTNFAWNLFAKFQEISTFKNHFRGSKFWFWKILSVTNCTNSKFCQDSSTSIFPIYVSSKVCTQPQFEKTKNSLSLEKIFVKSMHDFTEILLKWFPRLKFRHFHNTEMCQRNIQFHVKSAKNRKIDEFPHCVFCLLLLSEWIKYQWRTT